MKIFTALFATIFIFLFFNLVEGWGGDCDRWSRNYPSDWRQNHHWHHHRHHGHDHGWNENPGGNKPPVTTTNRPFVQPTAYPEYVPQFNNNDYEDGSREVLDDNGMNNFDASLNARMTKKG